MPNQNYGRALHAPETSCDTVAVVQPDAKELAVARVLRACRADLLTAAAVDGVNIDELARRLQVAPKVVIDFFLSEGDIRFSTLVLFSRALGRKWDFQLLGKIALAPENLPNGSPDDLVNFT